MMLMLLLLSIRMVCVCVCMCVFKFILVHKLLLDKFQFCDKTRSRRIITAGWLVGWLVVSNLA